jgi:hypothetical protein
MVSPAPLQYRAVRSNDAFAAPTHLPFDNDNRYPTSEKAKSGSADRAASHEAYRIERRHPDRECPAEPTGRIGALVTFSTKPK